MAAARVATRLPGKPSVSILYRRTLAEMPADREEFEEALADGVTYSELSLPEAMKPASGGLPTLVVRKMTLGEPDASGRRAPVPSGLTSDLACDLVIAAVGETPDRALFESLGARVGKDGRPVVDPVTMAIGVPGLYATGDARRGPSSIIAAEADGRAAAYAILREAGISPTIEFYGPKAPDPEALSRRGEIIDSLPAEHPDFVKREAERCLSCGSACLRCVEVCPNRANVALPVAVGGPVTQSIQIVHVDDLCNECGNCGFFCPYDGRPYTDKPTLFRDEASLRASGNAGFAFTGKTDRPDLVVRATPGARDDVKTMPYSNWTAAAASSALLAVAQTIHESHRYLVAGGVA